MQEGLGGNTLLRKLSSPYVSVVCRGCSERGVVPLPLLSFHLLQGSCLVDKEIAQLAVRKTRCLTQGTEKLRGSATLAEAHLGEGGHGAGDGRAQCGDLERQPHAWSQCMESDGSGNLESG